MLKLVLVATENEPHSSFLELFDYLAHSSRVVMIRSRTKRRVMAKRYTPRQRQNLGAIRARGIELAAIAKFARHWEVAGEYLLTDSTVLRFPANQSLEGLLVPQVPRHQLNFQVTYANAEWLVGAQGRFVGRQFDDDQNTLPLQRFFTLDAEVSRAVSEQVRIFAAFQNLTVSRYQISSTPVFTIGPPVLFRLGIQYKT